MLQFLKKRTLEYILCGSTVSGKIQRAEHGHLIHRNKATLTYDKRYAVKLQCVEAVALYRE